ncbi:LysR family transcriptional regulator [Clostridium fungisolvens]|uniref:HTH-type transcriptional regulator CynR n=1 Tax=Clostridium fungisolvens TaxID=1604897 RepID=A0A6V8ST59_9CLOT|nr:LysR family transcriptional regulator [Clostridium fungisolvens]GFP78438.1 HTH-type transcriptional regulator CynR [Clostridium fungisolvens]
MDFKQLTYFLEIVKQGNITKASKKLHIAQPHLSQQLKMLEDELGVKLIERSTRKFQITSAGQILQNRCEQMIELMDTTLKEIKDIKDGLNGTLSIGTISSEGDTLLLNKIMNFYDKYPGITFDIREGNTKEILKLLTDGFIEIGIIRTPVNSEGFESIYLESAPMVAATKGNIYWDEKTKQIPITELANKPLLVNRRFEKNILEACENAGFDPNIFCKIEDTRSLLTWANKGMGVAILPKDWVGLLKNSNLVFKDIDEPSLITKTGIIWMKDKYLSAPAKRFLEIFEI